MNNQIESDQIIANAKAAWRRKEITTDDLIGICRRAGMDAALAITADEIEQARKSGAISFKEAARLKKELAPE